MSSEDRAVAALDIGSSKVAAVIAKATGDGGRDILGVGLADSHGIRRGAIVDVGGAMESIEKAVAEAELIAGTRIDAVHLGLSSAHINGFNSRGVVSVAGDDHCIAPDDVQRAITAAEEVLLPTGQELLHVLPQDFVVDDQHRVRTPLGMAGVTLEANVHIVTTRVVSMRHVIDCVRQLGIAVIDVVLGQLAASEAVLTAEEKELGVALVDIGGGTTDYAIFEHGAICHTGAIAMGGEHFTEAIAVGLRTPPVAAERLKRRWGWAVPSDIDDHELIEVPSLGGRRSRRLPQRVLGDVLQPVATQMFELVQDQIRWAGFGKSLNAGLVLTGGGANLGGLPQLAEHVLDVPVRRGCPLGVGGLNASMNNPIFATAIGLVMYGITHPVGASLATLGSGPLQRIAQRVRRLVAREMLW